MKIEKVAIIGLGAIGAFVASKLSSVISRENLVIIAEGERKSRLEKGLVINGKPYQFQIVTPQECDEVADLVIIATKYQGLQQAIKDIKHRIGEHTVIMSLLNGVSSEEILQATYGQKVIYSLMRLSSIRTEEGIFFNDRNGYIEFGEANNEVRSERVLAIKKLFDEAHIQSRIPLDMMKALWHKYACNVAENQSSAILGIPFGAWQVSETANHLREMAMKEVFAVAAKKGIIFTEEDLMTQRQRLSHVPYGNKTSMLQDIENKRETEVEMFAGEMIAMGKEVGVPTPINLIFYDAIKILEEKNKGII